MRAVNAPLTGQGIGFWGPQRTRNGLFHGVSDSPAQSRAGQRAAGRVQLGCATAARSGVAVLVVSDENMIGTPRANLRARALYPQIGERMARFHNAFRATPRRVVLQIRSLDAYWASLMAYAVPRGVQFPDAAMLESLAAGSRHWRHVIADLACALPRTDILVTPFERFAAHPDRLFQRMTGTLFPPAATPGAFWYNRAPTLADLRQVLADRGEDAGVLPDTAGRWMPFSPLQAAQLREAYADDLYWLRAGAEGLARYIEDPDPDKTRSTWPPEPLTRGHDPHDTEDRAMARTR